MSSEILAKVIRGAAVESVHLGHLIVLDGAGHEIFAVGDPDSQTFWRSAAKPFQLLPFLTCGGADNFGFTEKQLALACGSHSGEKFHIETARKMLEMIGLSEKDLQCGAHLPFNDAAADAIIRRGENPTQIHNNCSGKHAAMLAFAKFSGANIRTYLDTDNPIQKEMLGVVSEFTETPANEIALATDGCSAPNFVVSIRAMARAFAKLVVSPEGFDEKTRNACAKIVSAMMNFPEMIGGTERLDTEIMRAAKGKVISKVGAEGVWSAGVLPSERWENGLGIALKIEDGDDKRARPVVAIEILRQLGVLSENDLIEYSPMPVKSRRGETVGKVVAEIKMS